MIALSLLIVYYIGMSSLLLVLVAIFKPWKQKEIEALEVVEEC